MRDLELDNNWTALQAPPPFCPCCHTDCDLQHQCEQNSNVRRAVHVSGLEGAELMGCWLCLPFSKPSQLCGPQQREIKNGFSTATYRCFQISHHS